MPKALTDKERQKIIDLIDEGKSRNDIARLVGRSPGTITNVARDAQRTFDRTATKAATEAKQADNAARRARIVEKMYSRAEELLDAMDRPVEVFNFGGRDNTFNKEVVEQPTFQDKRHIAGSVKMLVDGASDLESVDRGSQGLPAILELVATIRRKRDDGEAA